MRTSLRRRGAGLVATLGLASGLLLVGAVAPAAAGVPVTLTVGTTQDLDASNPFNTELVVGYEVFQLTYNLLTEFDKDTNPAEGFADSWERFPDRVEFHIRDGMQWSDGEPATAEDACYSWGLAMDAIAAETDLGYLSSGLSDAAITKVECPDASTLIAYTTDQSDRIFQIYMPILPEHIWGEFDYETIVEEGFDAPLVGTGPYTLAEWQTGQFARFVRNENFWGQQGFADEVVIRFFADQGDTMVQALRAGELDYAAGVNADQFKQLQTDPLYTAVAGAANGWTQLAFNTYGQYDGKTIEGGGPSTKALLDPKFRDALGYAVDKDQLVERVLGGFGDKGDTVVPPILQEWHVTPDTPRTFDIELAKQKLLDAGYPLDAEGRRLDKEGEPITLRLYHPNTDDAYGTSAAFIKEWYGQLGIGVEVASYDSDTLTEILLPPEAGEGYTADYDIELWGWSGSPDPNGLLIIFRCDQIGNLSDSQYCNPEYDRLYDLQSTQSGEDRKATLAQMQNLIYDEAVYDVLFYDANLHVYRNDRFAGWQNMPSNGTPFFTYGVLNYTLLTDANAEPTPGPTPTGGAPATGGPAATPSASGGPTTPTSGSGDMTPILLIIGAIAIAVVAGLALMNRRRSTATVEDE